MASIINEKSGENRVTLIIGAGLTGLTAAYCLSKGGKQCIVAEKESEIGGLCRTFWIDGIPFDFGPHVFFSDPDFDVNLFTMDLLKNEDMLCRPYRFAIIADGRYWKFPISLLEILKYPYRYKKDLLSNFIKNKTTTAYDVSSLATMISRKSGPLFYDNIFASLILKKTLMDGCDLHRDWWMRAERDVHNRVEPFVPVIKAGRIRERILRKLFPWYTYPKQGYDRIPKLIWERYLELGGQTILDCGPISFEILDGYISHVTIKGRSIAVENVIWTGSVNVLNRLIGAHVPELPYVDMIIVCITYNKTRQVKRPYIYTYHPQDSIAFNRIYYPENIFGSEIKLNREGLCYELNVTEKIKRLSESEIIARILEDTETLGLYPKDAMREARLFYLRESLPVYKLDYENTLAEAYNEIHSIRNLLAVGRMGGHFFCLAPSAIHQGLKVAQHLLKGD